jgi:hypothetical protein
MTLLLCIIEKTEYNSVDPDIYVIQNGSHAREYYFAGRMNPLMSKDPSASVFVITPYKSIKNP